jgi:hypothetical protein
MDNVLDLISRNGSFANEYYNYSSIIDSILKCQQLCLQDSEPQSSMRYTGDVTVPKLQCN